MPFPGAPVGERPAVERRQLRMLLPRGRQQVFVDHADREDRRLPAVFVSGIRIAVRQELPGERLEVFPDARHQRQGGAKIVQAADFDVRHILPGRYARGVEVDGHIDAGLLQPGDQVVEPVEPFRVELQPVLRPFGQHHVVVVNPHAVEAEPGQPHRQKVRLRMRELVGGPAEIDAVEPDRFAGAFRELEMVPCGDDPAEFSGRNMVQKRKVQRGILLHLELLFERPELLPRRDFPADLRTQGGHFAADRNAGDHPDRVAGRRQLQRFDRSGRIEGEAGEIEGRLRLRIASAPCDQRVVGAHAAPPVADVAVGFDLQPFGGAVGVGDFDGGDRADVFGSPAQSMQEIQPFAAPADSVDPGGFEQIFAVGAREHHTAFSAVPPGVQEFERGRRRKPAARASGPGRRFPPDRSSLPCRLPRFRRAMPYWPPG